MQRKLTGEPPRLAMPPGAVDTQMHLYLEGFPARPGGPPLPLGRAGIPEYKQVMHWLGIERVVVTQGNAYQFDNGCLLEAVRRLGGKARGVAVVTGDTSEADLQRLAEAGIRGARIMDLPGGAAGLSHLAAVDARVAPLGWCIAVQFDGSHILDHMALLESVRSRFVIDHHGKVFSGVEPGDPQVDAVKRLIDRGNGYFKLAGCYESSRSGGPDYADIGAVAREIVAHAPERVIWGTNWPHNMARTAEDYPDDGALLDLLLDWAPDEAVRRRILVDTPAELFGF